MTGPHSDHSITNPSARSGPYSQNLQARSIVIIGLMGAGKTSTGRQLAARLNRPFVDSDHEIEKAAGCAIADIFELYGETGFRDGERKVIARLLDGPPCVLATGGGAFIDEVTRQRILDNALSIWLRADLDLLVKRTTGRTHRPLLNKGNPREALEHLMNERYLIYAMADLTIDTYDEPHDATIKRVVAALREYDGAGK